MLNKMQENNNMKKKMSHRLEFLLSTIEETSDILKGIAHPHRLKILLSVYEKAIAHTELAEKLEIPKTTLSHHLNTLLGIQLVEKKERGMYAITIEGLDLIDSLSKLILSVKYHENERKAVQIRRYEALLSRFGEEKMNPSLKVEIVKLPDTKVIAIQALGKEPETKAIQKMDNWLKKHNFSKKELMIYGFNNPDPTPGKEEYGYEFYIPTDLNIEEDDTIKIKQMKGGTFAVTECHVIEDFEQIGRSWKELVALVKEQPDYGFGECFWYEHHPIPLPGSEGFILNLYLPVVEK